MSIPAPGPIPSIGSSALRGLGLGFMFVPITVAAFSGLQGGDIAQGAALFNLGRQLGGSLGIAVVDHIPGNYSEPCAACGRPCCSGGSQRSYDYRVSSPSRSYL